MTFFILIINVYISEIYHNNGILLPNQFIRTGKRFTYLKMKKATLGAIREENGENERGKWRERDQERRTRCTNYNIMIRPKATSTSTWFSVFYCFGPGWTMVHSWLSHNHLVQCIRISSTRIELMSTFYRLATHHLC